MPMHRPRANLRGPVVVRVDLEVCATAMSESDTFLDEILDGVTTTPHSKPEQAQPVPAPVPAPDETKPGEKAELSGLDLLLDGLSSPQTPNVVDSGPSLTEETNIPADDTNVEEAEEPAAAVEVDATTKPATSPGDLPVVAPNEILGLADQPETSTSHFDLATEVNDVSATEPATTESPQPHSFAAIAREIAATVGVEDGSSSGHKVSSEDLEEAERSSFYLRSSGRRRSPRIHRMNRMAAGQVLGLVLLLVLGLAGEYEYVSKSQPDTAATTTAITVPPVPVVRLPRVTPTKPAGTLFQFESSGSSESSPFKVAALFSVAWTVSCTELPKTSSVQVLFNSSGVTALNILIGVKTHSIRKGTSATLHPGTYTVEAHSPGTCTWIAKGIAHI
jgi:hypothetical protein